MSIELNQLSGYSAQINDMISRNRSTHFKRLVGISYLDHAGASQYSDLHMERYCHDLTSSLYGNPHSGSGSSIRATDVVNSVRTRILQHFNATADDYTVIFTRNCSTALHLLAESFQLSNTESQANSDPSAVGRQATSTLMTTTTKAADEGCSCESDKSLSSDGEHLFVNADQLLSYDQGSGKQCSRPHQPKNSAAQSCYAYLDDNHTSILGMRALLSERGAKLCCLTPSDVKNYLLIEGNNKVRGQKCNYGRTNNNTKRPGRYHANNLFAYPAQSNFNGCRHPLEWTNQIGGHRNCTEKGCNHWFVLLDASAMLTTSTVDLSLWKPDFMTLSFYKMFGFPTGVGALIVKNSSSHVLKRSFFGGGTVEMLLSRENVHVSRRVLNERFEDGTLPFLEIVAIKHGFDTLDTVAGTRQDISLHSYNLARLVFFELSQWQHSNGQPVAVLYHDNKAFSSIETQGPIINFNLLNPDGSYVGYAEVERLSSTYNIHLRTGCFCNSGRCQLHLELTSEKIRRNHEAGHTCGDSMDIIDGYPMGSVRISFGFSSTLEDCHMFLRFVKECFVQVTATVGSQTTSVGDGASKNRVPARIANIESSKSMAHSNPAERGPGRLGGFSRDIIKIQQVECCK